MKTFRSNPVLTVALSVAAVMLLSGGFATAAKWIDGKKIKPGSVATKQLKNRAVKTAKLAPGAVGTAQVKNRSITPAKLAAGVGVTGPTGATGPVGSTVAFSKTDQPALTIGPASSSVFNETYPLGPAGYLVSGFLKLNRNDFTPVTVFCSIERRFRDSEQNEYIQVQNVGAPVATVAAGGWVTVPLAGIALAEPHPADAGDLQIRVLCETDGETALLTQRQLNVIPVDQVNPAGG